MGTTTEARDYAAIAGALAVQRGDGARLPLTQEGAVKFFRLERSDGIAVLVNPERVTTVTAHESDGGMAWIGFDHPELVELVMGSPREVADILLGAAPDWSELDQPSAADGSEARR